ncbi:ARO9 [Candida oxycetoniae]|uniref:ARO9 n=1 Tax=Candida oxycetoniae TaxID=497107 RepID=A0AAI9WX18_9ASCO|nr:ARO9 [Candida oxycetoniae]KAI3403534.2 ARO9 [Candida oxycetoniae]
MNRFTIDHLISKRASKRESSHFTSGPQETPPVGFKPHPDPLLLSYGAPNNGFFPIESSKVNLVDYPFQHQDKLERDYFEENTHSVNITRYTTNPDLIDLSTGLQYAAVEGHKPLLQFTKDFIKRTHNPNYNQWESILTTGASDGLNKACDAILDVGDVILIEEFTFTPFLRFVNNAGATPIPIPIDFSPESNGINLNYLTEMLGNWSNKYPDLPKPKALYTIATGQNPTGLTQTFQFRKQVYKLAELHDFIIIEDDPYGYLTLPRYGTTTTTTTTTAAAAAAAAAPKEVTVDEYLKSHLTPSFLEIDTRGRVIRVETFSKLFAPGLRLGFIIAHESIIKVIKNYSETVNRGASGLSQLVVNNVIHDKFGGVDGWIGWILKMRQTYSQRKDLLLKTIFESKAYQQGLVDVIDPQAGMFVTFKIKFLDGRNQEEITTKMKQLLWKTISYGVRVVSGSNMSVDANFSSERSNFFRLCYAPANNDKEIIESGKRLTNAVLEFYNNGEKY